jgi:phosphoribosylamine---glycine ligase
MKHIGVYGTGGREHAIGAKIISEGHRVTAFWGNPWMKLDGIDCVELPKSFELLIQEIKARSIDLLIVWPEDPLCKGIVDALEKEGILVLGPSKAAALLLEWGKDEAKIFMKENNIPTAPWKTITSFNEGVQLYLETLSFPIVVKANGLAAGKWVKVCKTLEECIGHIQDCFNKKYDTGEKVVIEHFIPWREISAFAFMDTDSDTIKMFNTWTDHKAEYDGWKWDNTGWMGTFSPSLSNPILDEKILQMFQNLLAGLKKRGLVYKGPLFAGLMVNKDETSFNVLEYNVRFGDPETQSMLSRMTSSLAELTLKNAQGKLSEIESVTFSTQKAVTLVLADPGYPRTGTHKWNAITWLDMIDRDVKVYHMGTKSWENAEILVNGGRVLSLTAEWNTYAEAKAKVEKAASHILFWGEKPKMRTDIANYATWFEQVA